MYYYCKCSVALSRGAVGWLQCVIVIFPDHTHLLLMLFNLLTPSHGHRGQDLKCAVARPIPVSNSNTKFCWISSNGLGEDSDGRTDGWTDLIIITSSFF